MSSLQRLSSFETGSKKKFGKNLNKLQKPPAPPIAKDNGRAMSSKNGLLLLSTKRSSATKSTGLLSNKSLQRPVNGVSNGIDFGSLSHNVLPNTKPKEIDAWGTAEPQTVQPLKHASVNNSRNQPGVPILSHQEEGSAESRFDEHKVNGQEPNFVKENVTEDYSSDERNTGAFHPVQNGDPSPRKNAKKAPSVSEAETPAENKSKPERSLADPNASNEGDQMPTGPVIQLSSYDDRDRGERKTGSGPRMLYDPKSGAMVAVVPETSKAKKGKNKHRNGNREESSGRRKGKSKKEENGILRNGRHPASPNNGMEGGNMPSASSLSKRGIRLPRTCGALYLRDENGRCYSADGLDGDQGYGCHSVPGGKLRNPLAYEKFMEKKNAREESKGQEFNDKSCTTRNDLASSFDMKLSDGAFSPPEHSFEDQKIDWVKPNEKIELLTGAPESPTLKANAVAWTPSQAVLKAANAARDKINAERFSTGTLSIGTEDGENVTTDDDDDFEATINDPSSFIGLGFDPTENMDAVIQSPAIHSRTAQFEGVDLTSITLGPTKSNVAPSSIFAFGTSSTWGASGSKGGDSWGVAAEMASRQTDSIAASPFLSLSSTSAWGAGLPGLEGDNAVAGD